MTYFSHARAWEQSHCAQHSSSRSLLLSPQALPGFAAPFPSMIGHAEVMWCLPRVLIGWYLWGGLANQRGFTPWCCHSGDPLSMCKAKLRDSASQGNEEMERESCDITTPPPELRHWNLPTHIWYYNKIPLQGPLRNMWLMSLCKRPEDKISGHGGILQLLSDQSGTKLLLGRNCGGTETQGQPFYSVN